MQAFYVFTHNVVTLIIQPLIGFLMALALALFVWGAGQFILASGDAQKLESGKKNLLYGLIGLFIMTSVLGILRVVTATFGVNLPQ